MTVLLGVEMTAVRWMSLGVFTVLVLASVTVWLLGRLKPQADWSELKQRTAAWWWMVGFFFLSLLIDPRWAIVLFGVASYLALKEYFTLIHTRLEDHRALLWAYLAVPLQYWWIYSGWRAMVLIFIPVYMFLLIPLRLLLAGKPQGMVASMAKIQWGLMAFVFCISHLVFLLQIDPTPAVPEGGRALLVMLVVLTEMNDVAQYVWGKLLGRHAIAPAISPKKTWQGFLGGVFTTTLLASLLGPLCGLSLCISLWAGGLIAVSGFIGDLVMSAIKRDVGVKDSSHLIPGHGGIIDRLDSLTYTAPVFFHFVNYFVFRIQL